MKMSPTPARSEMDDPKTAEEARASVVDCGEVPFPLPTKRKPSTETGAAHIICHPELAKDLTAGPLAPSASHVGARARWIGATRELPLAIR